MSLRLSVYKTSEPVHSQLSD